MQYELIVKLKPGNPAPKWVTGDNRLDWVSPWPYFRMLLEEVINEGSMSQYVEHDYFEEDETGITNHLFFLTSTGAQKWYNTIKNGPPYEEFIIEPPMSNVLSLDIVERPDL